MHAFAYSGLVFASNMPSKVKGKPGSDTSLNQMTYNILLQVFKTMPSPCLLIKANAPHYTVSEANDAYLNKNSVTDDTFRDQSYFKNTVPKPQFATPSELQKIKTSLDKIVAGVKSDEIQIEIFDNINTTGESCYFTIQHLPVLGDKGTLDFIIQYTRPITEEVFTEKKAQVANNAALRGLEHLDILEKTTCTGRWELDIEKKELYWSDTLFEICGYKPRSFIPTAEISAAGIIPEDRQLAWNDWQNALHHGKPYRSNIRLKRPDGKIVHVVSYGQVTTGKDGKPVKLFGLLQDVSATVKLTNQLTATIKTLEDKNQFFQTVIDNIDIGIAVRKNNFDSNIILNKQYCQIYGWDESVICNQELFYKSIFPDEAYRNEIIQQVAEAAATGDLKRMHCTNVRITTATGEKRVINIRHIPLPDQGILIATVADVTLLHAQTKKLEETNIRYEYVTRATSDAIWDWDLEQGKVFWGEGYQNIFGYTAGGYKPDDNSFNKNIHPDDRKKTIKSLRTALAGVENYLTIEYRYAKANGEYADVLDKAFIIRNAGGKAIRVVGAMQDVTKHKAEQHRLRLLESIIENTNDGILVTEAEPITLPGPKILYVNQALQKLSGYTANELIGKNPRILQGELTCGETRKEINESLAKWKYYEGTILNYKKNGEPFWNNISITPLADEKGWYTHWISVQRDVTEKVKAQERLIYMNRLYAFSTRLNQFILQATDEMSVFKQACTAAIEVAKFKLAIIGMFDANGTMHIVQHCGLNHVDLNKAKAFYDAAGTPNYEVKNTGQNCVCNNFRGSENAGWPQLIEDAEANSGIILPVKKSGKIIGTLLLLAKEYDFFTSDEINLLERATSDITNALEFLEKDRARTHAEIELKENTNKLKQSQAIAHIGNWELDFASGVAVWSEEACRIYGIPVSENILSYEAWLNFVHPDDKAFVQEKINEAQTHLSELRIFHRILLKSGQTRHIFGHVEFIKNDDGVAVGLYGVCHDVTDFKETELQLIASQNKLRDLAIFNENLFQASPMGIASYDAVTGVCKSANYAYAKAVGSGTLDGVLQQNFRKIKSWVNSQIAADAEATIETGNTHANQVFLYTTFGTQAWLDYKFIRFYDKGHPHLLLMVQNITERKQAEILLNESQEKYRQIVETTQEGIFLLNSEGNIAFVNSRMCCLLEYAENELLGKHVLDLTGESGRQNATKQLARRMQGVSENFTHVYFSKTGKRIDVNISATPIFNNDGAYTGALAMITDVTEKTKLEQLFEKASKLARIGTWEINLVDGEVYFSSIAKEIYGLTSTGLVSKTEELNFYKEGSNRNKIAEKRNEALISGNMYDEEVIIVTTEGKEKWIRTIGEVELRDGKPVKLFGSFQDIDNRKRAELEALEMLQEKNKILESIDDVFFAIDKNWIVTYWNRQAENLLNIRKESIIGHNMWSVFKDFTNSVFYEKYHEALEKNTVINFEGYSTLVSKWFEVSVYPGNNGISVFFKDITERKLTEHRLRHERNMLRTLIDSLPDTIYYKDTNGKKLISNKVDYQLLGATNEAEVLGKTDTDIFTDERGTIGYEHDMEIIQTGIPLLDYENFFIDQENKGRWLLTSKLPLFNENKQIIGLLGIGRDITQRKKNLIELKQLNKKLESHVKQLEFTNKELEQFAYIASHDLQEPLRMVTSFLTQIEKKYNDVLDEKGKRYIYFAVDGAKRMRQIILDLLEYSRTGRLDTDTRMVDLNQVVEEVLQVHEKSATNKKAIFKIQTLPALMVPATPIRQVFQNLISNSLKYQQEGIAPVITISCLSLEKEWQFSVQDNGIGIAPEYFNKIFTIFQRLHNKDEYSGTGIGLAITKKIIELIGGNIWVESTPGQGACFYFTIPKTF